VGWTAHTLRHRFATVAYAGERDLLAVQVLLGHSKPETTRLYVLIPDASLRAAVAWAA
jgi:site-specific recombinase XerD